MVNNEKTNLIATYVFVNSVYGKTFKLNDLFTVEDILKYNTFHIIVLEGVSLKGANGRMGNPKRLPNHGCPVFDFSDAANKTITVELDGVLAQGNMGKVIGRVYHNRKRMRRV